MALIKSPTYDEKSRGKRADAYVSDLQKHIDLKGLRVLEIGPHLGDLSIRLVRDFDCEVVGIDQMANPNWPDLRRQHRNLRLIEGDIANPPAELQCDSFDLVVSFVVWEHIRHPWSALKTCQRLLKTTGKKFMRANLYRSSIASHLYKDLDEPWPHLRFQVNQLEKMLGRPVGWAYWVNKLTYQQYLFYFRQLGFYVNHERFWQAHFNQSVYDKDEMTLGLYPKWDLKTDFFEVLLEFDGQHPKQPIPDAVYRRK